MFRRLLVFVLTLTALAGGQSVRNQTSYYWQKAQIDAWRQNYPVSGFGAVPGGSVDAAFSAIAALVPASSSGTMYLPAGVFNTSTGIDTSSTGYFNLQGSNDGWSQYSSVIKCNVSSAIPCITDSNHQGNPATTTHTYHWNHFALLTPTVASDGFYMNATGNFQAGLDHLGCYGTTIGNRWAGTGACFHVLNSFTNFFDHLLSQGGSYGMWQDNGGVGAESFVRDTQFTQAAIANFRVDNNAVFFDGDLSVVGSRSSGGIAGLWVHIGQTGEYRGYFEGGTSSFANGRAIQFDAQTLGQDARFIWFGGTSYCADFGYNNVCEKSQGTWGSWNGISYTNLFPNSSATGAVGGIGLTYSAFTGTQDCTTNTTSTARGCSYKLIQTAAGNSSFGFGSFSFTTNHAYMLRATVWCDKTYARDSDPAQPNADFLVQLTPPGNAAWPTNLTAPMCDTTPREVGLVMYATATGAGNAYFTLSNTVAAGTVWVSDIVLADVTNLHTINVLSMPYIQTYGATTAQYSSAGLQLQGNGTDVAPAGGKVNIAPGAGINVSVSGNTVNVSATFAGNGAFIYFAPGAQTSISSSNFYNPIKVVTNGVIDNIVGVAPSFTCTVNPVITLEDCGTTTACASPGAMATVTLTAANTLTVGTIPNPSLIAGHYYVWEVPAGTCTALNPNVTIEYHN